MDTRTTSTKGAWIQQIEQRATQTPMLLLLLILPVWGAQGAVFFTTLYSFTGGDDGDSPSALVQGSDGYFYGTTPEGGTNGGGTLFKISTNGALTTLYAFGTITNASGGALDGAGPNGLVQDSDGYFYGTTSGGGTNDVANGGDGTVFRISTNGALTTLYSFGSVQDTNGFLLDGAWPGAGLVQGSDGNFFGTTTYFGTSSYGSVFKISTNGTLTSLCSFGYPNPSAYPRAALVQGSDGYFYGTTAGLYSVGGALNGASVFKISTNGVLTTLYSFPGDSTTAALVQGGDGYFYGTIVNGGPGAGTVFKISTNGALTTLYTFTNAGGEASDGVAPRAGVVQGSDGYFYGTTEYIAMGLDGYKGFGTVFKISTNGALTTLYSFGSVQDTNGVPLDGANPFAALVQGSDGSFYGTTSCGGKNGAGTVFRLTIVPEPQLTIIPSGPYVILTWPTNYAGFTLQSTTKLGSAAVWTSNSSPPVVIGGENVVINAASGKQQFYRLSQ